MTPAQILTTVVDCSGMAALDVATLAGKARQDLSRITTGKIANPGWESMVAYIKAGGGSVRVELRHGRVLEV